MLTPLHYTSVSPYTCARPTTATNRLAELAMNSRHPRAVASASSLGSRLQSVPVPVCQQLLQERGVELGGSTGL